MPISGPTESIRQEESFKVLVSSPKDHDGVAVASEWLTMKDYARAVAQVYTGAIAGGAAVVSLEQATDSAGTGAKALTFDEYYTIASVAGSKAVKVESGTLTLDTADTSYDVNIAHGDFDDDFAYFKVNITDPAASDFYAVSVVFDSPGLRTTPDSMVSP